MTQSINFKHGRFSIEVEFNDGACEAAIWTLEPLELVYIFNFSIEDVTNLPVSEVVFLGNGHSYEPVERHIAINHYHYGFEYCRSEVIDYIINSELLWTTYID